MTTLRRLLVAVYPIRLFLLALAAWSVAAEVWAQSPIRVGYYDMNIGAGVTVEQEPPIVAAGFTPVQLFNVTAADLAGLHVLFVQNSSPMAYGAEYLASKAAVQDAVNAGLVLVIHDRFVGPSPAMTRSILPLPAGVMPVVTRVNSQNNSVTDATTLVANGPGGIVTETNLDGGMNSNMGFVNLATLTIAGRVGLIHTGVAANSVTFSYPLGAGFVIYSSIPLDMFLKGLGPAAPSAAFRTIYAPNVLAYAACGLRALPATVTATGATAHYGGTTTLTATVKCGVVPVPGATVNFSLNGAAVGSAHTDASGTATLANASLGSAPASAIAVGSYPAGVGAAFAGTTLYGASSGTASLTVEKAPASISFDGGTFVYDAAPHAATGSVTGVFGEALGAPSFSYTDDHDVTSDAAPRNAGTYRITASVPESANYLGTTAGSGPKIKIAPAPLVVTADDRTKLYGAALPALTGTFEGFVGDENASVLGGTLLITTSATAASAVGEYRITPSGVASNNYEIAFVAGRLTVSPAPLTIRADDKERLVGKLNPVLTVTYDGFVLDDTEGILDVRPSVATTATVSSPVGNYPIVAAGASDSNYTIDYVNGGLTISPEGRVHGSGFVDAEGARHHFVFDARETIVLGEKGSLSLRVERLTGSDVFLSQLITSVVFTNNSGIAPGGNAVVDGVAVVGLGTWNGVAATFELLAFDMGEPGVGNDTVTLRIKVAGRVVNTTQGALNGGNVQSNRVK